MTIMTMTMVVTMKIMTITILMMTREPVAFFCYFSSFELMTRDKKESKSCLTIMTIRIMISYHSFILFSFSHAHSYYTVKQDKHWLVFLAGGVAGICSWVTTYPQVRPPIHR